MHTFIFIKYTWTSLFSEVNVSERSVENYLENGNSLTANFVQETQYPCTKEIHTLDE